MGDYEASTTVQVDPDRLFAYLSDVEQLPAYLPRLTEAHATHDDKVDVTAVIQPEGEARREVEAEAWMEVVEPGRKLRWGSPGPNDYRGELDVDAADGDSSVLTVRLHTEHAEGDQIDHGLDEALAGIKSAVEQREV
jgi:uncharacterized protein YndB with AHSA1/START domain